MSTSCYIGVENPDMSVDYIYCHHDGYPSYTGRILKEYYNNSDIVHQLVSLGDMSAIGITPEVDPDGWNPSKFWGGSKCVTYASRGDELEIHHSNSPYCFIKESTGEFDIEYVYLFTKDNEWKYWNMTSPDCCKDL